MADRAFRRHSAVGTKEKISPYRKSRLNGRNAWLESAPLTQQRKREKELGHIGNPG